MYDLVIKNGKIIDGTGNPSYFADIAVKDGKIARIGKAIEGGARVIDAAGLVVTPGFIDSHSHSDNAVFAFPDQTEKIEQGITTAVGGQCGSSLFPVTRDLTPENDAPIGEYGRTSEVLKNGSSYFRVASTVPQGSNLVTLVGHGALRKAVMGMENRPSTPEELEKMKALLRDALEAGALGLSFGLIYTPGVYAQYEEMLELAKVAGEYHAVVSAHIRGESSNLIRATEEFLSIVRSAKVRGVLSHHKASGKENWGKVTHTLRMLQEANDEGYEVYCDVYPYIASHTSLAATFVPSELHALGVTKVLADPAQRAKIREWILGKWGSNDDFGWIQIAMCKGYPDYEGLRIPEIAKRHGKDVYETIFDMIHDSDNACSACYFTMCEEDVKTVMAWERTMIGTDSSVARGNKVYHPRLRGTFPRVLGKYVREEGVTTLTEMIRKITSMPATVYGLRSKGQLHEGFDADICIFDAEVIIDRAEFTACWQRAEGLKYVLLGGEVVVEDAVYNGKRLGHVMKREAL